MAYRKIEDSKLVAIANSIRCKLGATVSMNPDEMPGMIDSIGIGVVPTYWKSYLETKATEINTALNAAGENKSAFLWYTDAHWANNYGKSPMILKYLSKHTGMTKTFFGGDIAVATSGEIPMLTAWKDLVKDIPNHHSVIGNHDNQVSELSTAEARGDFFIVRTGDMAMGTDATNGNNYYYIDNHIEKTRYICLSTGRMWTYKDEMVWCVDVLNNTPQNWHIVIISHLWLNNDYSSSGTVINSTPPDYTQSYLDMFDAYNYRSSGTTSVNSVAYDFASAKAKVEFVLGGHVHQDYDFTTAKGIPVILTECDSWQERDDVSVATKGTITENCVYAFVADYTAKVVKIINGGRGDTRSVPIPDVVTYTNWAKKAYADASMTTIYNNGKGYKENTRLNSSGNDTSESGWYVTGFIPAKPNDIIRLKNCYFPKTYAGSGTARTNIVSYKDDGSYGNNLVSQSGLPDLVQAYDTDGNNILQIKVPSWFGSTFVRMTLQQMSDDSIITVNEEID